MLNGDSHKNHAATDTVPLSVAIGIATTGRAAQMLLTLAHVSRLTPPPLGVWVAPASAADLDLIAAGAVLGGIPLHVAQSPAKGLTIQRNAILDALESTDAQIVTFFDDDYYPARDYIVKVQTIFSAEGALMGLTGRPALDGATGPGIDHETASRVVQELDQQAVRPVFKATYGTYGCNMSFRLSTIRQQRLRFDESLPLYGWLEDIDFSRRAACFGTIAESNELRGVHLGTKGGRVSGIRFGYSQIANPLYCVRKRSMSAPYAFKHMAKNLAMNAARSLFPESWIDRRGRLWGNFLALKDVVFGTADPSRVMKL